MLELISSLTPGWVTRQGFCCWGFPVLQSRLNTEQLLHTRAPSPKDAFVSRVSLHRISLVTNIIHLEGRSILIWPSILTLPETECQCWGVRDVQHHHKSSQFLLSLGISLFLLEFGEGFPVFCHNVHISGNTEIILLKWVKAWREASSRYWEGWIHL